MTSVAFSPDGRLIVQGVVDRTPPLRKERSVCDGTGKNKHVCLCKLLSCKYRIDPSQLLPGEIGMFEGFYRVVDLADFA